MTPTLPDPADSAGSGVVVLSVEAPAATDAEPTVPPTDVAGPVAAPRPPLVFGTKNG